MIKRVLLFILIYSFMWIQMTFGEETDYTEDERTYNPQPNEVVVTQVGIGVPVERIILIRKNDKYGAIKFTKY